MLCFMVIYKTVNLFLVYSKWYLVRSMYLNKALSWCDIIHVCNYSMEFLLEINLKLLKLTLSFHSFDKILLIAYSTGQMLSAY